MAKYRTIHKQRQPQVETNASDKRSLKDVDYMYKKLLKRKVFKREY